MLCMIFGVLAFLLRLLYGYFIPRLNTGKKQNNKEV